MSSCHRVTADILFIPDFPEVERLAESNNNDMAGASDNVIEQKDYSKFRISAGMGGGYRIDKVSDRLSPGEKDHVKKMKWGMNVEIDGEYYVSESIGIGFASSWFRSSATLTVNESGISSSIKDRINLF